MELTYLEKELADYFVSMNPKKLVIVKPGCKEFGNELLNRMSIYAYGLEVGARVIYHSGYGYSGLWRVLHAVYARYIGRRHAKCALLAWRAPIFLPPTKPPPVAERCDTLYFFGWVFRNPLGLLKYRKEIIETFTPHIISSLPVGRTCIGVHLRQKPFAGFPSGDFLISVERVRTVVDEYVREKNLHAKNIALLIVSDLPIHENIFAEYEHRIVCGNIETNLFLLARCSAIIGTNTTFSNVAAWFGNVPHIVPKRGNLF